MPLFVSLVRSSCASFVCPFCMSLCVMYIGVSLFRYGVSSFVNYLVGSFVVRYVLPSLVVSSFSYSLLS